MSMNDDRCEVCGHRADDPRGSDLIRHYRPRYHEADGTPIPREDPRWGEPVVEEGAVACFCTTHEAPELKLKLKGRVHRVPNPDYRPKEVAAILKRVRAKAAKWPKPEASP
jgi:hypothetical protein